MNRYMTFVLVPVLALNVALFSEPIVDEVTLIYASCAVAVAVTGVTFSMVGVYIMHVDMTLKVHFYFVVNRSVLKLLER